MKKKTKQPKDPRPLSWVKLNTEWMDKDMIEQYIENYGSSDFLLYMGEMPNQRGHCVIFNHATGKMHVGCHIENFVEMTEEEV